MAKFAKTLTAPLDLGTLLAATTGMPADVPCPAEIDAILLWRYPLASHRDLRSMPVLPPAGPS